MFQSLLNRNVFLPPPRESWEKFEKFYECTPYTIQRTSHEIPYIKVENVVLDSEDAKRKLWNRLSINILYLHGNATNILESIERMRYVATVLKDLLLLEYEEWYDKIVITFFAYEYPHYEDGKIESINQRELLSWCQSVQEDFRLQIKHQDYEKIVNIGVGYSLGSSMMVKLMWYLRDTLHAYILEAMFSSLYKLVKGYYRGIFGGTAVALAWSDSKYEYFNNIKQLDAFGIRDFKIICHCGTEDKYCTDSLTDISDLYANSKIDKLKFTNYTHDEFLTSYGNVNLAEEIFSFIKTFIDEKDKKKFERSLS